MCMCTDRKSFGITYSHRTFYRPNDHQKCWSVDNIKSTGQMTKHKESQTSVRDTSICR